MAPWPPLSRSLRRTVQRSRLGGRGSISAPGWPRWQVGIVFRPSPADCHENRMAGCSAMHDTHVLAVIIFIHNSALSALVGCLARPVGGSHDLRELDAIASQTECRGSRPSDRRCFLGRALSVPGVPDPRRPGRCADEAGLDAIQCPVSGAAGRRRRSRREFGEASQQVHRISGLRSGKLLPGDDPQGLGRIAGSKRSPAQFRARL